MKRVRGTFGTIYNSMTDECFIDTDNIAEMLAKNWGNIPKYLGNKKAFEIHTVAKGYVHFQKQIEKLQKQNEKLKYIATHIKNLAVLPDRLQKQLAEDATKILKEIEVDK